MSEMSEASEMSANISYIFPWVGDPTTDFEYVTGSLVYPCAKPYIETNKLKSRFPHDDTQSLEEFFVDSMYVAKAYSVDEMQYVDLVPPCSSLGAAARSEGAFNKVVSAHLISGTRRCDVTELVRQLVGPDRNQHGHSYKLGEILPYLFIRSGVFFPLQDTRLAVVSRIGRYELDDQTYEVGDTFVPRRQ